MKMPTPCITNSSAAYRQSLHSTAWAGEFFAHLQNCPQCCQKLRSYIQSLAAETSDNCGEELWAYYSEDWPQIGIVVSARALWAVTFGHPALDIDLQPVSDKVKIVSRAELPGLGQKALLSIQAYFQSGTPLPVYELNLGLVKSAFQREVLLWTRLIPYGQTCSYGELARLMGQPKSARAIGRAEKANPLPLFIPCHRVIGSNGQLVGFGGGLALKQWLLEREQVGVER